MSSSDIFTTYMSKKITRSHTSIIDAAKPLIKAGEKTSLVSKMSLGIIKHIGTGKPSLKFHPITGGVKVVVRGNTTIQELYFYTQETNTVIDILKQSFPLSN
jgi:hypothetical protein